MCGVSAPERKGKTRLLSARARAWPPACCPARWRSIEADALLVAVGLGALRRAFSQHAIGPECMLLLDEASDRACGHAPRIGDLSRDGTTSSI